MHDVVFIDMKAAWGNSLEKKFRKLLQKSKLESFIKPGELVAIKVHVGERENLGYVNHNYARLTAEAVIKAGGKPFLTDTNTLYSGGRHNGIDHCITANMHGYSLSNTNAPFFTADGLRGLDYEEIEINKKHIKKAKLASGITKADKVIFLTHFKGHIEAGFGGTIKNMAMGAAAVPGKMEQHSSIKPSIIAASCVGCRQCFMACPVKAITMNSNKASIDHQICIGCGQCMAACNYQAIPPSFDDHSDKFLEKVCEYAYAVNHVLQNKGFYINFAVNITPDCDCWPANDVPLVQDVGIFASYNPLALDKATLDKVSLSRANPNSPHAQKIQNKSNVFNEVKPESNSSYIFDYCKKLGMTDEYNLLKEE